MQQLRDLIRRVARTDATVLVQGESGTGKELVSRAIYRESPRANSPFITVNCAAIPENLIESEFFGHEKGSFTGAQNKREGRFELAHSGTILLDEVSEVSPQVQAKLLRVLQERELERVGGNRTIKVDVRVIATTNRNLQESVAKKEFRQDLYFRLNVVPVFVPPLRQRREDIHQLADTFMKRFSRKHGVRVAGISASCTSALLAHDWPGNVRELQNVVERAVILCSDGEDLSAVHLGFTPGQGLGAGVFDFGPSLAGPVGAPAEANVSSGQGNAEVLTLAEVEKQAILRALDSCRGNRTHAAKKLGISIRTLRNKLNEYGVSGAREDGGADEEDAA
jgi:transcriptional regulator with PAS, ATPase and Fis domain